MISQLSQWTEAHSNATVLIALFLIFGVGCPLWLFIRNAIERHNAVPSDPVCVGGQTPCKCTCSMECHLAY